MRGRPNEHRAYCAKGLTRERLDAREAGTREEGLMGTINKDRLLAAIEVRYDYYSARTLFTQCVKRAGLTAKDAYEASEVVAFCDALTELGDRAESVVELIRTWAGLVPAQAPKEADEDLPKAGLPAVDPKPAGAGSLPAAPAYPASHFAMPNLENSLHQTDKASPVPQSHFRQFCTSVRNSSWMQQ